MYTGTPVFGRNNKNIRVRTAGPPEGNQCTSIVAIDDIFTCKICVTL